MCGSSFSTMKMHAFQNVYVLIWYYVAFFNSLKPVFFTVERWEMKNVFRHTSNLCLHYKTGIFCIIYLIHQHYVKLYTKANRLRHVGGLVLLLPLFYCVRVLLLTNICYTYTKESLISVCTKQVLIHKNLNWHLKLM